MSTEKIILKFENRPFFQDEIKIDVDRLPNKKN
jgi:hypothetical protein